ncbi:MAG TPA: DUF2497 domain-containing protein [Methylocystis sp.]|nr:DUF2497 domain-containing protein [Methylocystis sp.]
MNAPSSPLAASGRAAEPSMEDILASIRRIIADDDTVASRRERRRTAQAQLERAPPVAVEQKLPAEAEPQVEEHAPEPEYLQDDEPELAAYDDRHYAFSDYARQEETALEPAAPLVSADAAASVTAQFQTLAASMVINDSGLLHEYAREMLRPMLKAWLDDNLPVLVERLVRAEIERVARGGKR